MAKAISVPVLTEYTEILNCNFLPREETSQDEAVMIWSSVVKWLFKTNNSQAYEVSKICLIALNSSQNRDTTM